MTFFFFSAERLGRVARHQVVNAFEVRSELYNDIAREFDMDPTEVIFEI